ncbi:MAG: hypothetical protein E7632_09670 [Ruminococcaceae bacterium]|nr:hypothetical protein [Oscillospiraceae bacterium]
MISVNDYRCTTDSETLEAAIAARTADGIVVIPPRVSDIEPERTYWLIDRAILIPENTTIVLQNCKIKLSDRCRDNFFRSANCGIGIEFPEPIRNIHLRGEGLCILEGADHPRAVGDGSKILKNPCPYRDEDILKYADYVDEDRRQSGKLNWNDHHAYSYGTDAGKEGESQYGDWRGIGVLFANAENFSISGLRLVRTHGWGISMEACSHGYVSKIDFDSHMYGNVDGMDMNMENQDGVNLRNGCHDIIVSDITGQTGDDVVALTAIANPNYEPGGSLRNTHVMHNDWTKRERDIHDVIIRNVVAHSYHCYEVRLLPSNASVYNIVIDGVIDTAPTLDHESHGTILLGDSSYGDFSKMEKMMNDLRNITISNCICGNLSKSSNEGKAIMLEGYLKDSTITNVINKNPAHPVITVKREEGLINVTASGLVTANK